MKLVQAYQIPKIGRAKKMRKMLRRLFLILGVILLINLCMSCRDAKKYEVQYIRVSSSTNAEEGEYKIIYSNAELKALSWGDTYSESPTLWEDVYHMYNNRFFTSGILVAFFVIESSEYNMSEVKSYEISDDTMTIYLELVREGDTTTAGCWVMLIPLAKKDFTELNHVVIFKEGIDITAK